MRRYLIGQQIGGTDAPLEYANLYIVEGNNPDNARLHYNELHKTAGIYGTVLAYVKEDRTTKYVRTGLIDNKKMVYMFKNNTLVPYNDRKGEINNERFIDR